MQKNIRQSMAWLHSWTGLLLGWLLFAIFLMGSMSYYRHEITMWMQPELAQYDVAQETALKTAYQYLDVHAHDAKSWYIGVASEKSPVNNVYWQKADGGFERKTLNPATGQELQLSATKGGDFFYEFHFQLFGVPYLVGRIIVCIAAFIMLIALVSGIITHKKIFTDFFTLRTFKSQRSWLDFHNVSSVLALPFFLTITFTGLAIFFYIYLPWGMQKLYPDDPFQYFKEIRAKATEQTVVSSTRQDLPINTLLATVHKEWGDTTFDSVSAQNPNTTHSQITFTQSKDETITQNRPTLTLNAQTGEVIANTRNDSAIATLSFGVYGLHMATFAQPLLRLAFFFSGILGCFMIASGLLLWSLKRQLQNKQQHFHFGHYLVDRLNVASFVGLPIAMLSYLFANRLIDVQASTANYEIISFFTVWLSSFLLALVTPRQLLWKSQLSVFIFCSISLACFNLMYLVQHDYVHHISSYWIFLRIDLMLIIFAGLALFILKNIHPIQTHAHKKLSKKIHSTKNTKNTEVNAS